ncbi:MAG TPA: hypothetical protein VJP78_08610 [Thermoleophilia bacterium]|nr:hypothetical protein [Thermoleophilia bacterium]
MIARDSSNRMVTAAANDRLDAFLHDMQALVLPTQGTDTRGHDDHVSSPANLYQCDFICTYNVRDFENHGIEALPPLAIHFDFPGTAIEYPILGEDGTLLVGTRYYGNRTMGRILRAKNGTEVRSCSPGRIEVVGPDVGCQLYGQIPEGYAATFVFRYKKNGHFEAAAWVSDPVTGDSSGKLLLAQGTACFEPPVRPLMFFGQNYGFAGELFGVSGIPQYVRDGRMRPVLASGTLEVVEKSEDISALLADIDVLIDPAGFSVIVLNVQDRRTRTAAPPNRSRSDG